MKTRTNLFLTMLVFLLASYSQLQSQQLAFPTAEGYGKYTTGGRGGKVYEVTNLNSSGSGSFGEAISASGARTVVFRVSGTITGEFNIKNDNITIAGQTAPGDGICIKGNLSTSADNIIIRYIRVRHDPSIIGDALGGRFHKNIIFDHVSTSWSADEVLTLYHNENTTVQWCIIAEGCEKIENGVSEGHRFGGIWGNNYGTWHHNLIAHNDNRNPRWASGCGYNDYRNNVVYNWGYGSCNGGEKQQVGDDNYSFSTINMIANYYKPGPATTAIRIAQPGARSTTDKGDWYVADNYFDGHSDITNDNWSGMSGSNFIRMSAPWSAMAINQESPQDAYNSVLDKAGCSFPVRDKVDLDVIDDVRTGKAKYGNNGIISVPGDVGGWPVLASGTAPTDSDHDGMPDSWESANGTNPNSADNNGDVDGDGYTNLEEYLNSLVDGTTVTPPTETYTLSTSVSGQGSVSPSSGSYSKGSTVSLTASPASGWKFDNWSGDASGSSNPISLTMNSNKSVTANFSQASSTGTLTIQENETGFCSVDGAIENNNSGFTGDGFANTDNASGEGVTWSVNIATSGTYTLKWRFANGGSSDRTAKLMVDGSTVVSNVSMPASGGWSSWSEASVNVTLSAGTKLIRLEATNASGLANIDYITLSGESLSAVACSGLKSTLSIADESEVKFYPVPAGNTLNIEFSKESKGAVDVYLFDMTGKTLRTERANSSSYALDLSDLPQGLYTVKVMGESLNVTKHISKK